MNNLSRHYALLLGLDDSWEVAGAELSLENQSVSIELKHRGRGKLVCPQCGAACAIADHAPPRSWRHLDTMQFETLLTARVPRAKCKQCGVKTVPVPWAGKHSRFTLMFESFVIEVIRACSSLSAAATLLRLDWDSVQRIMRRAVDRGLQRRELAEVTHLGIDEKSFRRGHNYISVLTDQTGSRVLEVVEGRDQEAADQLWETLSDEQKEKVEAVAIDMWQAFENSIRANVPGADIVHDRFHVSKHLGDAVDKVRRGEHKQLRSDGDETLTRTKQLWLFNPENLSDEQWLEFERLKDLELKTSRAWAIKEQFRWFWEYAYAGNAEKFFSRWYAWAVRCRLKAVVKVAKMLKKRLGNLLTYFRHRITNAKSEGFNSRIQTIKSAARGFRAFENFRTRILFYCGKLDLMPR